MRLGATSVDTVKLADSEPHCGPESGQIRSTRGNSVDLGQIWADDRNWTKVGTISKLSRAWPDLGQLRHTRGPTSARNWSALARFGPPGGARRSRMRGHGV